MRIKPTNKMLISPVFKMSRNDVRKMTYQQNKIVIFSKPSIEVTMKGVPDNIMFKILFDTRYKLIALAQADMLLHDMAEFLHKDYDKNNGMFNPRDCIGGYFIKKNQTIEISEFEESSLPEVRNGFPLWERVKVMFEDTKFKVVEYKSFLQQPKVLFPNETDLEFDMFMKIRREE